MNFSKFNLRKNLLLALIIITGASCEKFLDVNTDLDQPSKSTPDFLLPPILGLTAVNCYEQGETTGYFAQHVATLSGVSAVKDRWDYSRVTRVGLFRRHYFDVAGNAKNLIETANEEGSKNYEALGHILMVLSTQTATDLFGQMPYREALKGNPSPPYDDQSVIYDGMLAEIDEAISLLEKSDETDRLLTSKEDIVYDGNLSLWLGFAHGLKARLLLHLTPNINQDYQAVLNEVDLALAGWQDPVFPYIADGTKWEKNLWGPTIDRPQWDYIDNILHSSAPTPYLVEQVMGYDPVLQVINDPRMPLMIKPDTLGEYLTIAPSEGKESIKSDDEYPNLYDTYYTSDDSPLPFMTKEELFFIKSEVAFKSGNIAVAYTAFVDGITEHMIRVGVDMADINTYLASAMVPSSSANLELSHIMSQKWLALYLQAEAWVDMRRYQYDTKVYIGLKRPQNLAFFWAENNDNEWIQRLAYDNQTEEIYNKPELDRLGAFQNPEWLKVPLWWTGK